MPIPFPIGPVAPPAAVVCAGYDSCKAVRDGRFSVERHDPWDGRLDTNLIVLPDSPDELVEALIYVDSRLGRSLHLRGSE